MKKIFLFLLSGILYTLLSSSAWVKLTLMHPSPLQLPDYIKSIAMVDRTKQENNARNRTERALTGEAFRPDEQGVLQLDEGFIEACSGTQRYVTVRTAERYMGGNIKNALPSPLPWDTIQAICDRNHTDAVMSVELFDSDFMIAPDPVRVQVGGSGNNPFHLEFKITGVVVINLGIRLYDAVNRVIMDEYQTTYRQNFDAQGLSVQAALNMMLDKVEATKRAGYQAGFEYGTRITPTYYQVTRVFYNRPKRVLGKGVRYSEVADWKSAIEAWTPVVNNGSRRKAGRAAFDIAVAYEVLGDLSKAKEWAAKSHTEFKDKQADDYYKMLNNRIVEEGIADQQMGGGN